MVFIPTYLYIKQHSVTGKLYFGKTINNPEKYLGSGTVWKRHYKKHGKEHIVTLWFELFPNKINLIDFALEFSKSLNIVESSSWLNLKPENGLDGGDCISSLSDEKYQIWLEKHKNHRHSEITKSKMIKSRTGKKYPNRKSHNQSGELGSMHNKVTAFNLLTHEICVITKEEFNAYKNIKYVGNRNKLASRAI